MFVYIYILVFHASVYVHLYNGLMYVALMLQLALHQILQLACVLLCVSKV
jgi:hypothetical protein